MIQIDDAGSGSLIGGTCIGILRIETMEYYYEIIPLDYYNTDNFKKKMYLYFTLDIIKKGISILKISKKEQINICRGYMFDISCKWLYQNNYLVKRDKIEEPLQEIVENTFQNYTNKLGLSEIFIKYNKYPFQFHNIIKWVYADYENRKSLCKVGWKSWQKYGKSDYSIKLKNINIPSKFCYKCGNLITINEDVYEITYITNKINTIYIHTYC
ncbi:MAG: hypothetical protein QME46_11170 [Thermoanaerobacteraceae bacterium]|nr:hypothetical protein [Thermoanaerobacteraceae bacterium]